MLATCPFTLAVLDTGWIHLGSCLLGVCGLPASWICAAMATGSRLLHPNPCWHPTLLWGKGKGPDAM